MTDTIKSVNTEEKVYFEIPVSDIYIYIYAV